MEFAKKHARNLYTCAAMTGALALTGEAEVTRTDDDEIEPVVLCLNNGELVEIWPEQDNPGEYANADELHRRYGNLTREQLFERLLTVEGYLFGYTGRTAPE